MRKLALIAPLAALALLAPGAASAASCTPPKVSGFAITGVHETLIGCHYADAVVHHWFKPGGAAAGYSCQSTVVGRSVRVHCRQHERHDATVSFSYHVD